MKKSELWRAALGIELGTLFGLRQKRPSQVIVFSSVYMGVQGGLLLYGADSGGLMARFCARPVFV